MRAASWSLRLEIIRVSCPAATPCATSACDSARMSAAHWTSAGTSAARRMADASSRTDSRCRLKRSRSDTTPATVPSPSQHDDVADAALRHDQRGVAGGGVDRAA